MKRVASLYLPDWPIERLRRAERHAAPPEAAPSYPQNDALESLTAMAAEEQRVSCSVPRGGGWRPGARWARAEIEAQIAALPSHQRPSMRELGRREESVRPPFQTLRSESLPPRAGAEGAAKPEEAFGAKRDRQAPSPSTTGRTDDGPPRDRLSTSAQARDRAPAKAGALAAACHVSNAPAFAGARRVPSSKEINTRKLREDLSPAPLVTAIREGNKQVIAAVSPAARAAGLTPGMAATQARAQVPGLDIRPADPEGDATDLHRLAVTAARRWSPLVAISGADGLFLDLSGTAHLFGGEARMARRLVRLLARLGFTARIAVADTTGAAWALARATLCHSSESWDLTPQERNSNQKDSSLRWGDGFVICPPGAHLNAIAPLPCATLRIENKPLELLKRLGVERIGQLAAMPRGPLVKRFGTALLARLDQASGRVAEPLAPIVPPVPIVVGQRFAEPIATAEAIEHWLGELMPRLVTALTEAGQGARAIELVADRIDGVPQIIRIGLARPTRDAPHLLRLIVRRIEEIAPGYGIDALHLHVRRADPLGAQPFEERLEEKPADLAPLVDTLANRIGNARLWRMKPVESDVPERSLESAPPLDPPPRDTCRLKLGDVRLLDTRATDHPWHHRWPRPVRLLRRPEQLDHVLAELPDQPPRRFTWRGTTHRVVCADGPERILGEWWKRAGEAQMVRDYFQVEDETGKRFWLFRRGDGERPETGDLAWFIHGAFG